MVSLSMLMADYVVQSVLTVGGEEDRLKVVNRLKGQMFPSQYTLPLEISTHRSVATQIRFKCVREGTVALPAAGQARAGR